MEEEKNRVNQDHLDAAEEDEEEEEEEEEEETIIDRLNPQKKRKLLFSQMRLYTCRLGENGKGFFIVEVHLQVLLSNNL